MQTYKLIIGGFLGGVIGSIIAVPLGDLNVILLPITCGACIGVGVFFKMSESIAKKAKQAGLGFAGGVVFLLVIWFD